MKENEKETETEGDLYLDDPPPVWDVDGKDVSDEDNDSTFGSDAELDSDDEPASTTGTNIPQFPSLPSAPPTQVRGSTDTVIRHPSVPSSSTTTIPPTQGPPPVSLPVYTPHLCVVRNFRITSFAFISSLSIHADLQRETGL